MARHKTLGRDEDYYPQTRPDDPNKYDPRDNIDAEYNAGADLNQRAFPAIDGDDEMLMETDPMWRDLNPRAAPNRKPATYQDRIAMALNGRSEPDGDENGGPMPPDGDGDEGSDMDMMMKYGPEDQVAYDQAGRPIPLADPRHPMSQQRAPMRPSYPQQRR